METLEAKTTGHDTPAHLERRGIPAELWLTIAQSLEVSLDGCFPFYPVRLFDMPALKNLRLVSRALNGVTEPLYWERIELSANVRLQEALEVIKHIKANPVHSNYVKYLVLKNWRAKESVEGMEDDVEATSELSDLFTSMWNLRAIHFDWVYLSPNMVAHIFSLHELQFLGFAGHPIIPRSIPPDYKNLHVPSVSLNRVRLSQTPDARSCLRLSACIDLFVNPTSLEKLRVSFWVAPIVYDMPTEAPFCNLQTFETPDPVDTDRFHQFYNFTRRCPNLENLIFSRIATDGLATLDLIPPPPSDVLSQLRSFSGALSTAGQIVPTRPVEELNVSCFSQSAHTLTFGPALQKCSTSSKTIRVFCLKLVDLNEYHLFQIASSLPLIEELEIGLTGHFMLGGDRKNEVVLHVDQLGPLTRLRSFTFKNTGRTLGGNTEMPEPLPAMKDGPGQIEVMRALTKNHPLEYVEIGQTVRWHKERDGWTWRSVDECVAVNL